MTWSFNTCPFNSQLQTLYSEAAINSAFQTFVSVFALSLPVPNIFLSTCSLSPSSKHFPHQLPFTSQLHFHQHLPFHSQFQTFSSSFTIPLPVPNIFFGTYLLTPSSKNFPQHLTYNSQFQTFCSAFTLPLPIPNIFLSTYPWTPSYKYFPQNLPFNSQLQTFSSAMCIHYIWLSYQ
jgi:hypothetical protein